jgi:preprotein translocase subunit SecA
MLSIGTIAAKVFGTSNDRKLKTYRPNVEAINALEPEVEHLSDTELRARTALFRKQLTTVSRSTTSRCRPATVREAAKRTLGQRHFDAADRRHGAAPGQDLGDEDGRGKTLVATLAVYPATRSRATRMS